MITPLQKVWERKVSEVQFIRIMVRQRLPEVSFQIISAVFFRFSLLEKNTWDIQLHKRLLAHGFQGFCPWLMGPVALGHHGKSPQRRKLLTSWQSGDKEAGKLVTDVEISRMHHQWWYNFLLYAHLLKIQCLPILLETWASEGQVVTWLCTLFSILLHNSLLTHLGYTTSTLPYYDHNVKISFRRLMLVISNILNTNQTMLILWCPKKKALHFMLGIHLDAH